MNFKIKNLKLKKRLAKTLSFFLLLSVILAGTAAWLAHPAKADSLIGFNEGYGTTTHDSSGSASGTITSAVWKPASECLSGPCLYFDGSSSYVSFGNETTFNFAAATNWTIELWFRTIPISSGTRTLIAKYNATAGGYKIYMSSDGRINFGIDDVSTGFPKDLVTSTSRYDDDLWHFVSASKTGTTNISLYLDGQFVNQKTSLSSTGTLSNSDTFYVGVDGGGISNFWSGFIDELKVVVATAQSASQVKADYLKDASVRGLSARVGPDLSRLTQGLVGYWKMDETSGNPADSSGNGLTLTNNGVTPFSGGEFGNAAGAFNGTTQYFNSATTGSAFNITGDITISAWIKRGATSLGDQGIISKTNLTAWDYDFFIAGTSSGVSCASPSNKIGIYATAFGGSTAYCSNSTITDTTSWHHVVVTRSGSTISFYIDGRLDGTSSNSTSFGSNSYPIYIGYEGGAYFNGKIDEARIYNRALSPAEVTALYNWAPGPAAYWKFDENTGTTANDTSGIQDRTATLGSSPDTPSWVAGKFGSALKFDGVNDYVSVAGTNTAGAKSLLNGVGTFTLSAWVKFNSLSDFAEIVTHTTGPDGIELNLSAAGQGGNDDVEFCIYDGTNTNNCGYTSTNIIHTGVWYHLEGVFNGSLSGNANRAKLYVNGIQQSLTFLNTIPAATVNTTQNFYFGSFNGTSNFLDGTIDNLIVYDYPRTPSQVIEDMNAGHPAPGSPVGSSLAWWKFDEDYGTTLNNSGNYGSGANATSSGTLWNNNGRISNALQYNGTAAYAATPALALLASNSTTYNTVTWDSWIKPTSSAVSKTLIIKNNEFRLTTDASSKANCQIYSASWQTAAVSLNALPLNSWSHVVCTYDGANINLYVNGILSGTQPQTGNLTSSNTTGINFGWNTAGGQYFSGLIDEVKIYNFALTSDQVKQEYNLSSALVLGALSDTSNLAGGSTASSSAAAAYCIPGDSTACAPPVAEWKMEENTGQYANDSSGNGNQGILGSTSAVETSDPTWSVCKVGSCLSFDGSDDVVSVTTGDSITNIFDSGGTISLWVYLTGQGSGVPRLIDKVSGPNGWFLYYGVSGSSARLYFDQNFTGSTAEWQTTNYEVPLNSWHHITLTYNNSAVGNNPTFYVDGLSKPNTRNTAPVGTRQSDSGVSLEFGNSSSAFNPAQGSIDELKLYNYIRTPAQIAWDYNRDTPLIWYKFDECTGTTAYNSVLNASGQAAGNDAAITIGATGTYTSAGTCSSGVSTQAWNAGTTGKYNSSMAFDGTDDFANTSSTVDLSTTNKFTLSFWLNWNAYANDDKLAMESSTNYNNNGGAILVNPDASAGGAAGRFSFAYDRSSIGGAYRSESIVRPSAGVWHHYVAVFDQSVTNGDIQVFVDGIERPTTVDVSDTTNITAFGNYTWYFMSRAGTTLFGAGKLDDVRIYNFSLTTAQIKNLYNQGSTVRFSP